MPQDEVTELDIDEFRIEDTMLSSSWVMIGPPQSGKTTLIENLCYYLKHRYPTGRAFIGTQSGYDKFCDIMHPLYVSNQWDEEEEKRHIVRQRTCEMENVAALGKIDGKKYPGNFAINILDDISDDPKVYRTKTYRGLVKLGSQHYNQLFVTGSQYAIDMPPDVRKSVSYVALFREPEELERQKLYKNFGGICGNYQTFCSIMDGITGDYTCVIIIKRSQTNDLEDCVKYYKTKVLKPWKFGCKEYRQWAEARYNKDYVDEIII